MSEMVRVKLLQSRSGPVDGRAVSWDVGTIMEVDENTAARMIRRNQAELVKGEQISEEATAAAAPAAPVLTPEPAEMGTPAPEDDEPAINEPPRKPAKQAKKPQTKRGE